MLEGATNVPAWGQASNNFHWGAGFNGYGVNGALDEIGVWNRPLTSTEVALLYNGGIGNTYPFAPIDTVGPATSAVTITPGAISVGAAAHLSAKISDTATGGSNIASAYYGIGGGAATQMLLTPDPLVPSRASASANLSPFSVSDLYTVCVRGTDGFGNTGPDSCERLPVYNAAGPWITGGGRMIVPPTAYDSNPTPATLHFKAKYASGAIAPSGVFELRGVGNSNLHFESNRLDWLVLVATQRRAVIRGTGRLNARYDCTFEAEAWADSYQPGNQQRVSLRVFDCTGGGGLNLGPAEVQGSIIIHLQ